MRLESLGVTNFRSIINTEEIVLNDRTIIVGKNNEGKSNYLNALNIALNLLLELSNTRFLINRYHRLPRYERNLFIWKRDYPLKNQSKSKFPPTTFTLKFSLNDEELKELKEKTSLSLTKYLIVEIKITKNDLDLSFDMTIYKHNKNKTQIKRQIEKIVEFINENIKYVYIPAIRTEKNLWKL